jgi:transposase
VDQPATIGALPVAVAQAAGVAVGYLSGLSMRRIADLHPGEAKTDARDAFNIADAARTMPHTLRAVHVAEEEQAELSMLCGFDEDLTQQATAVSNRIRGLLTQIHPDLEKVLGPRLDHPAVHVVVVGTGAAGIVLPELAAMLAGIHEARAKVLTRVEALVEAHPLHAVLTSLPAVGVRTAARILTDVVGKDFPTAGHLASYAGLCPVTWRSGSSIRGDHASRRGSKALKRVLFLSAFASLKDPVCRAYYDRKRGEGKRHNQALVALARKCCDTLYAMLRDGTLYTPKAAAGA